MTSVLLSTLNAKYIHANLGIRYLYANMHELKEVSKIQEFTIKTRSLDIVEDILKQTPKIVGFGVYIWNIEETLAVIAQLKAVSPKTIVIVGGPEVSYETDSHPIAQYADYVVTGPADLSFYQLCKDILAGRAPIQKLVKSKAIKLDELDLPYQYYNNDDLANRLIYVEASRGCPFKCEFCLSALDKTSTPFDLDNFLSEMEKLYERGARHFKFVDRTFNLKIKTTLKILDFFLKKLDDKLFLHFEVIPDHLPDALKEALQKFPPGSLQFEVGIQTFNVDVQTLISRKQNNEKSKNNLIWLKQNTHAHIHADLIFGLPGETIESFKDSFNQLYQCSPHEIQVGILKRLKGSPIIRHTDEHQLRFNPLPPYNILSNKDVTFQDLQNINRFARYWDMMANSGRFKFSLKHVIEENPFDDFNKIVDFMFLETGQTFKINLKRLYQLLWIYSERFDAQQREQIQSNLLKDYQASKLKGRLLPSDQQPKTQTMHRRADRQMRHLG